MRKDLVEKMHIEETLPEFPFANIESGQAVGYISECKHCFQCGYFKALCSNKKAHNKFCFFGWYTAGLVPDSLCSYYEPNPTWQSISPNYFMSRLTHLDRLGLTLNEDLKDVDNINELLYKPLNVFILGTEPETTTAEVVAKWNWLKIGVDKPLFKIKKTDDIPRMVDDLRNTVVSIETLGLIPSIYLKWNENLSDEYTDAVVKVIRETESVQTVNIATRLVHSELIQDNEINNLAYLNHSLWFYDQKDIFKDKPFLCIAGGPSLTELIPKIRENQDKFIIMCVSTIAKLLYDNGIIPHVITTIDMKHNNGVYIETMPQELMDTSILAFEIDAYHETVDKYKGEKMMVIADLDKAPITSILLDYKKESTIIPKSGTVSNLIYNMSKYMGASVVYMIGYDLCYLGTNSHADGAKLNTRVKVVDGSVGKFLQFDDLQQVEEAMEVETYGGEKTLTSKTFYTYLLELAYRVNEEPIVPTFDLSLKSSKKEGIYYKNFDEVIDELEKIEYNPIEILKNKEKQLFSSSVVKNIIKSISYGIHSGDAKQNHLSRLIYILKQYDIFPQLKHDNITQVMLTSINKESEKLLAENINKSINKFRKLNIAKGERK